MDLREALDEADAWSTVEGFDETDNGDRAVVALLTLAARLDTIDRRALQVRGGLKPYARPVDVVDFLLAETPLP